MKNKKALLVVLAIMVLLTAAVAGTVAWLMDTTDTVENTFTVGNIDIDLNEHKLGDDGVLTDEIVKSNDNYQIIPGESQVKDPYVTVKANSEDAYVFVKIEAVNNTYGDLQYVTWNIAGDTWTQLTDENGDPVEGVYYLTNNYTQTNADVDYYVLQGSTDEDANGNVMTYGYVTYSSDLTKEAMDNLYTTDENGNKVLKSADELPKLKFTAYAIQASSADTAYAAWLQVSA